MLRRSAIVTVFVHVWFAHIPTTWIPGLAVGSILYLLWHSFRQTLKQRQDERERQHRRLAHWGNE
jgi:hypothetical protein